MRVCIYNDCNQNSTQPDAFLPTGRSHMRAEPDLLVNKNSSYIWLGMSEGVAIERSLCSMVYV